MLSKRILLIPDAYFGDYSGAYVAQVAKQLLVEIGCIVAIYSDEVHEDFIESDGTRVFYRDKCSYTANWIQRKHKAKYLSTLREFKPDAIFTLGSVTNKNIIFWSLARNWGIKVISFIFMQDFFCYNFYANDACGICTKCLDSGFKAAVFRNCSRSDEKGIKGFAKKLNSTIIRYRLQKELTKASAVITSSKQQVEFYVKYGIPRDNCYTTPLYFNGEKLSQYIPTMGDYFVYIAQNRIDKGVHLLKEVLTNCNKNIRVIAAYSTPMNAEYALQNYGLQPFVDNGMLVIKTGCTWKTDLGELIASSRGVINLSIWPTTTEFVLLEALGLKKPIFTFNVGIHPEIIDSGVNGFIADNPFEMAIQINHMAENKYNFHAISQEAYKLFLIITNRENWKTRLEEILSK